METMLKIKAGIMRVLSIVIIFLFAFMTVIGTYQIVTRYFFNKPSTVSEELLTYIRKNRLLQPIRLIRYRILKCLMI